MNIRYGGAVLQLREICKDFAKACSDYEAAYCANPRDDEKADEAFIRMQIIASAFRQGVRFGALEAHRPELLKWLEGGQ